MLTTFQTTAGSLDDPGGKLQLLSAFKSLHGLEGPGRATNLNIFSVTSKLLANLRMDAAKDDMADEQRTSDPDILKVEEIAKYPFTVKGHVLDLLLWHHTFEEPTSEVRESHGTPEPTKGNHVLYILVFRKLRSIMELQGRCFFNVWLQCIECHFNLWHAGVLHRDISPPNLTYYKDDKGRLIGVLNDYDISSLANGLGPQGNERTGTMPFMALDLLTKKGQRDKVKHLYRHDLESFMWVLSWVVLQYKDGKLLTSGRPLDEWASKDALTVYKEKATFLRDFFDLDPIGSDPLMWSLAFDCLNVLRSERDRQKDLQFEQWKRNGGISYTGTERDNGAFLDLFRSSDAWIELSMSLQ